MRRGSLVVLAAVVVVSGLGFAWLRFAPRHVPPGQPTLTTLRPDSLSDFRAAFNAAEGNVRIIALFSPT